MVFEHAFWDITDSGRNNLIHCSNYHTRVSDSSSRYCGRHLNPEVDQLTEVSVCSKYFLNTSTHMYSLLSKPVLFSGRTYPFRVSVYTDENEVCTAADPSTCEADITIAGLPGHPGGITGFAINYVQAAC